MAKIKFTFKQRWHYLVIKIHHFLVWKTSISICQGAEDACFRHGKRMRQNTAYADDERNYVVMCPRCAQINSEYWAERWHEYYADCM